jgi:hypothetical protein
VLPLWGSLQKGYINRKETEEKKSKGKGIIEIGGKNKGIKGNIKGMIGKPKGKKTGTQAIKVGTSLVTPLLACPMFNKPSLGNEGLLRATLSTPPNSKNEGLRKEDIRGNQQGKQTVQGGVALNKGTEVTQQTKSKVGGMIGGKGIEIEYKEIMKIKKKYKGEYVNKAHIFEMLSGLCKKIIK